MVEKIADRLLSWASILEVQAREQAIQTAEMPFVYPHVALMPDAHLGIGSTVGSVIPTLGAVIPAAVGVDIGCGMAAVRTQLTVADVDGNDRPLAKLRELIADVVPLSPGNYNTELTDSAQKRCDELVKHAAVRGVAPDHYAPNWREQLGTLGGGNHFIEVCRDEQDRIWLFLHSGSRGVGNKIAKHHIKVARKLCGQWWITLSDPNLAYLPQHTSEFSRYIADLHWAQAFALANRDEMMDRVIDACSQWIGHPVEDCERINTHHNFTKQERHAGKDVWVTRKGAVEAPAGKLGLIPGSMGTRSYVVVGKGNASALNSAPHGAGRQHSRSAAKKLFTHADLREAMTGIEWRDSDDFLDEHPKAYKDVDVVMADAADLVEIRHTLVQLVNIKGT